MVYESFETAFDRMNKSKTPEKIISIILAIIFAFVMAATAYIATDITPATFDDYVPLNEKLVSVQEEPTSLLKGDGVITISNGVINYTVENNECKMTGTYDQDYKLIQKSQKDKSMNNLVANLAAFTIFIIIAVLSYVTLYFAIFVVLIIANIIINWYKKQKSKRASKKEDEEIEQIENEEPSEQEESEDDDSKDLNSENLSDEEIEEEKTNE